MTIWKPIKGYEGRYEVSTWGQVRSLDRTVRNTKGVLAHLRGKLLNPAVGKAGYKVAFLRDGKESKAFSVHRLVALAFLPNAENKSEVNHKNGIRTDNRVSNLEWVTPSENKCHAYNNGLNSQKHRRKLTPSQVRELRNTDISLSQASKKFGVSMGCAQRARSKETYREVI